VEVLHDISLTIQPGQLVAIIGANRAGKTTLLRAISNIVRPSSGRILFDGKSTRPLLLICWHEVESFTFRKAVRLCRRSAYGTIS
jgi:ABC-type cobalamin/Fe3+-siderophores transport system ATPase subunit